jgi:hypothetical protein
MNKRLVLLAGLTFCSMVAYGQSASPIYTLTAYANVGFVRNFSQFEAQPAGLDRTGFAGSIRVMWKPEYLLSAGLEVDRTHVYSVDQDQVQSEFGTTDLHASKAAWLILPVFSMSPLPALEVNVGIGSAISTASVESFGNTSNSSEFGSAFMASVAYLVPLSENLRLGGELKFLRINKYEDDNLSLQVTLAYRFLEW